ncbi:MAG TPA: ADYC domain-containing protein [Pseudomonadota bacterium]|nr:ADYC domain-containing protein [Pseudomonadota bacterium]HNK43620.1 ADYC domain-containing protein [Pseudomonadota bacterium]HNN54038.1 ADYC domain-containing protein [Pseudomonadota bacterium]
MKRSIFSMLCGLSLLAATGCQNANQATEQDSVQVKLKACQARDPETGACQDPNGSKIFNPEKPDYSFAIGYPDWSGFEYMVTGFYPEAGKWKVRGWSMSPDPLAPDHHVKSDGQVEGMLVDGNLLKVKFMEARQTRLLITFCDATGTLCDTLDVNSMFDKKLAMLLSIPNPTGRGVTMFQWTFTSGANPVEYVKAWGADVVGQYVNTAAKGQVPTSLCKKTGGADEYVVFEQGYLWDPDTYGRTVDPLAITVACEEGAIAEGLARGYTPWSTGKLDAGMEANMADFQQAFIRMKTADYCGIGKSHTLDGTKYLINAPIDPARDRDPMPNLEAIWGPDGAFCVIPDNRRHKEITMACALPDCDAATVDARRNYNLMDSIP